MWQALPDEPMDIRDVKIDRLLLAEECVISCVKQNKKLFAR